MAPLDQMKSHGNCFYLGPQQNNSGSDSCSVSITGSLAFVAGVMGQILKYGNVAIWVEFRLHE